MKGWRDVLLALAGFVALYAFAVPFPWIVIAAGAIGFVSTRGTVPADTPVPDTVRRPGTFVAALVCLFLWLGKVEGLRVALGGDHVLSQIAVFFSTVALVTFGGAYAVLSYIAQQAVETYAWLAPGEMLNGLGLAETTPGPLILVTQFVGFLAAQRAAWCGPVCAGQSTCEHLLIRHVHFPRQLPKHLTGQQQRRPRGD